MLRSVWVFGVVAAFTSASSAQVPPEQALSTFTPGVGLQVELFAAEPMLLNPTAIDVDTKGRVWVAEAVNYRRVNFNRPILREAGDRIVILTDSNSDGKADTSTVFYQGPELYGPLGVLVLPLPGASHPDAVRVLVAQSPDILEFTDADGDGQADGPPTKFLTGFGGFDHDHGVHGLTTGPDGKLYFTVGDQGVTGLQSKDGSGKKWVTTKDRTGDCQAGTIWRCDLDGNNLELIAHNFRNNYEAAVDRLGEVWCSDNDDDGHQQTRICFVMPGGNYGYWPRGAGETHWHEEQPGVVHKTLRTGFGSPTGIAFYEGTLFPQLNGQLLHTDAGPRELRAFKRIPKGAGYELDKTLLLTSTDNWFRASDVCVAPDGSIFVADWYDPGVGGHGMGDWTRGRIYRLTPEGHVGYKVSALKLASAEGITQALTNPATSVRIAALVAAAAPSSQPSAPSTPDLANLSLAECRELLLQARTKPVEEFQTQFYKLAARYDGQDIFYRAALNIACGTDAARRDAILADFPTHFPDWTDTVADLVWELRPKSMLPKLGPLMTDPALSALQKARIVDILAASEEPAAGQTLIQLLTGDQPAEVKARALDNLRLFLPTKWASVAKSPELAAALTSLLGGEQREIGLQLVCAANAVDALPRVADLAADASQPSTVRNQAIRTLGELKGEASVAALKPLLNDDTVALDAVRALGEQTAVRADVPAVGQSLKLLEAIVTGEAPAAQKQAALEALAGTRAGTNWMLGLQERNEFPSALVTDAGRLLRTSPFQGERNKALQLFPAPGKMKLEALPSPAELAARSGDAANGKRLLAASLTAETQCLKCHKVRGEGGEIGPDLTLIGVKGSKENLLESILNPSKAIADQYVSWIVETEDGQTLTGLIVSESETTITLRDANGKDYPLPKDGTTRRKSLISLMPENLVATLTEAELIDLVEHLMTLKTESASN